MKRLVLAIAYIVIADSAVYGAEQPGKKTPKTESTSSRAAVVESGTTETEPLGATGNWKVVPEYLDGAQIRTLPLPRDDAGVASSCRIKSGGVVVLAAERVPQPNLPQNLARQELRAAQKQLEKMGWVVIGTIRRENVPGSGERTLFRRVMKADEKLAFDSKAYAPPILLVLTDERARRALNQKHSGLSLQEMSHLKPPPDPAGLGANSPRDVVMLTTHDLDAATPGPGIFQRELARQAFLLAARDELDLATRDGSLREAFPREPKAVFLPFDMLVAVTPNRTVLLTIFRQTGRDFEILWEKELILAATGTFENLVAQCESLSRQEFVEVLKRAGLKRNSRSKVVAAPAPTESSSGPDDFNFLGQFAMLQRLHDAIKTNGESSERLAALARGYAHIGVETESLWSPAHKVFKARALLYAERLARQTKESPFSLWNRAYVRALVGRHQAALDDLALAAREPTDKASATGGKKPDWVKVIKAFCEFDSATLAKADQNARLRPLARYLKMFAEEFEYSFLLRTQSVAELRDVTPDCFRALELLAANSPLTADRNIREEAIRLFPTSLYRRTADMPGLADAAKSLCKTALADASHDNGNMDTEIRNRQQLIGLLEQSAGNPSRRTEPSWAALAALIRETGFLHAWRIVNLKKHRLGIQADATIDSLAPLVAQHPYRKYLDTHRNNNTAVSAAWKELAVSIDTSELELTEGTMLDSLGRTNRMFPENTFYDVAFFRLDPVYRDLAPLAIRTHNNYRSNHISILKEASPHSPQLAIAEILAAQQATDPALALANAPVWERRFNRNSSVLAELSELYIKFARDEAALRCAKREVELSPEVTPCLRLARLYKKQGDLDRWKATLDLYLQGQSYGLDHCDVRIEIANYYMEQKKWGLALPYAVLAADSWASRGLLTAVRCYDGMEDWKNAELYVRRCSERYEFSTDAYEWFFWCRRTGQGDAEAARRLARSYVNSLSASQVMRQPVLVATYQQLCGDLDGALQTLSATWNNTSDPWYALFAALVAHDLDRPDVRNMLLDQIARRGKNFQSNNRVREELIALAAMIAEQIAAGNDASFDQEKFEKLVQSARFGDRTNLQYFAGRFLARRGQIKLAKKHLLQATAAREVIVTWTLAATLLQEKAFAIEDGPE